MAQGFNKSLGSGSWGSGFTLSVLGCTFRYPRPSAAIDSSQIRTTPARGPAVHFQAEILQHSAQRPPMTLRSDGLYVGVIHSKLPMINYRRHNNRGGEVQVTASTYPKTCSEPSIAVCRVNSTTPRYWLILHVKAVGCIALRLSLPHF